jgi:hypothetical protein
MANPTNPFSWQMPTASDLVTDLPADFEVFGQAVATSLQDLLGGTTGQVLAKASNTNMDFTWVAQDDSNAIQNAIVDAKGDLIAASANDTPARLAVGNNGETLVADSSTSTGLRYQANFAAGKNKIINGDFNINQRSFSSTTTNLDYGFDRFALGAADGTVTYSAQTFTAGTAPVAGYEAKNFARIVSASQTGTNALAGLRQRIESVRTFAGQTVTVSFWAKASTGTPNVVVWAQQDFGTGGSPSTAVNTGSTKQAISSSWARYSFSIAVPSISGKTLGTTNDGYLAFILVTSAGSDRAAYTDSIGIQNITVDFWGVQVEAGNVATAFQTATGTLQGELAACQRYYFRMTPGSFDASNNYGVFGSGYATSTTACEMLINAPVQMRVRPTVLDYSSTVPFDGVALGTAFSALAISNNSTPLVASIAATGSSGLTQYRTYSLHTNNSTTGFVGLGAEL